MYDIKIRYINHIISYRLNASYTDIYLSLFLENGEEIKLTSFYDYGYKEVQLDETEQLVKIFEKNIRRKPLEKK